MTTIPNNTESTLASFIWKNADDLWGDFPHTEFGKIILPLTVLRRLECVLEPTKQAVIAANEQFKDKGMAMDDILKNVSGNPFYNTSNYNLSNLGGTKTKANLEDYIANFSDNVRVIFEQFDFSSTINKLAKANLLLRICNNFSAIDLHPSVVPDRTMSNVYEHLIARFGAEVGTGSEDFMTPRDIVHLAATLLLEPDNELFEQKQGLIRTIYDQTCGTSGFLTDMMNYVEGYKDRYNVAPVLVPYGQELQPETHAVALGSMLLKKLESDPSRDLSQNIKLGSTLSQDHYSGQYFHYQCSNPPFGMSWAKDAAKVQQEYSEKGFTGRFGAGLPKASDGSMLFLQNLISKLEKPENGGGRGAIVLSGSPLFNGGAGSGESEIRRFILESDYLEAIVALPTDIFFRTGIGTYIWLLSNRKPEHRKGKVQLIDATGMGASMRKNEGNKRKFVDQNSIDEITRIYTDFQESPISKIFDYTDFGYRRVKVLRPLRIDLVFDAEKLNTFKESKEFGKLAESDQNAVSSYIEKQFGESKDYTWFETSFLKNLPLSKVSKALKNALISAFGVQNPDADTVTINGDVQMDSDLTDYENIPLKQDIHAFMGKEVLPHAPDAVIDTSYTDSKDNQVGVVGYEINFNRYFYVFEQPRHPNEIMAEIKELSAEVAQLLGGDLIMQFKEYPSYKNSGVEWLGDVPSDWHVKRFGYIFSENKTKNRGLIENNVLSLSYGNIKEKNVEDNKGLLPESFETYQLIEPNDIIFRFTDLQNDKRSLRSAISNYKGIITSAYISVRTRQNAEYFNYLFRAYDLQKVYYSMGDGMRQSLKIDELNRMPITVPNQQIQTQIANYLDQETQKIDTLIAKQEKLIELLEEQRKSVISHAVTKGLDPNAPMKDSGVEWLGDVPSHWNFTRIDGISKIVRGNSAFAKADLLEAGQYIALQYGRTYKVDGINTSFNSYVNQEFFKDTQVANFQDVILISTSETLEDLGHSCFYALHNLGLIGGEQFLLKPKAHISGKYLYYATKAFSNFLQRYATGLKVFRFNLDDLKNIHIPNLSLEEQERIVCFVDQQTIRIDTLIQKQKSLIEKLKEYRASIISHAVTGKIDVRELVA